MKKLLLTDDNEMNRDILTRLLKKWGYGVVCATDGQQAVSMAQSEHPDLILMDMSLPVMDGFEATRQIKAQESTKHIPIVAMTAHVSEKDQAKTREAGCLDFVSKPIDFQDMLKKIRNCLGE